MSSPLSRLELSLLILSVVHKTDEEFGDDIKEAEEHGDRSSDHFQFVTLFFTTFDETVTKKGDQDFIMELSDKATVMVMRVGDLNKETLRACASVKP